MTALLFRKLFLFLIFAVSVYAQESAEKGSWEQEFRFENSNYTIDTQGTSVGDYRYNYNRARFDLALTKKKYFAQVIADAVHLYGDDFVQATHTLIESTQADTPLELQTDLNRYSKGAYYGKIYRAYAGFEDDTKRITAGLQKLSMGVGQIWTPSDIFNAKNPYALEPDEIFGVLALSYTQNLSTLGSITALVSQRADKTAKYALRQKSSYRYGDVGFNLIKSDDTQMIGTELESTIKEGQLRAELIYIKSRELDKELVQSLLGYDYVFSNGVIFTLENLYNETVFSALARQNAADTEVINNLHRAHLYSGVTMAYEINLYLSISLSFVQSFEKNNNSAYIAPSLIYVINDNNTLTLGAQTTQGAMNSEFGALGETLFFNYKLSL